MEGEEELEGRTFYRRNNTFEPAGMIKNGASAWINLLNQVESGKRNRWHPKLRRRKTTLKEGRN